MHPSLGHIPESLGHISTLQTLDLNGNNLSGLVPQSLFNISSLKYLAVANNSLIGRLPSDIGYMIPSIKAHSILWSLPNLEVLDLGNNNLDAGDWGFISSLSNCSKLTTLKLDGNNLQGNLPSSFGNLSGSIEFLWLCNNNISGPIPPEIGNLKNLNELSMEYNIFNGTIPPTIGNLRSLVRLNLEHNKLSGQIPDTIGNLVQLTDLVLGVNNLSGKISATIGHCTQLHILKLAHNSLDGSIPGSILQISSLLELNLSHNYLSGAIPEGVGNLINLKNLSMSHNRLSGNIPPNLGKCVVLEYLEMQSNNLVGTIPQSFANLVSIKDMDISLNNLSGNIPEFFTSLSSLHHLDLSFNNFDGVVPRGGIFDSAGAVFIEGNDHLCANVPIGRMPLCSAVTDRNMKHKIFVLVLEISIPISLAVIFAFSYLAAIHWRKRMEVKPNFQKFNKNLKIITYGDIVNATDSFSSANLIGSGSFGVVYRGNLNLQEDKVAIKVFNLDIYGAYRSFVAECESLRNTRHRNLVKIITVCSSVDYNGADFKAVVFQYMPNGSLEMWLHPEDHEHSNRKILTLSQRINIAMDVASALDYLHNQCASPLIHCDLKPSNILLDHDMTAYVSDFGLARFLYTRNAHQDCSASLAYLKGSIGYNPPEYGMSEQISTKGDVYSFGVLLLEMMRGSSPTDEKFNDGVNLHDFVDRACPEKVHEIIDPLMLQDEIEAPKVMERCIIPLVRMGLSCSMTSPRERPEMGQVCAEITAIKHTFSNMANGTKWLKGSKL
ncbi:hypothetical protein ACP70R_043275 [Stipagrostis hirtigluma subsp. patula]